VNEKKSNIMKLKYPPVATFKNLSKKETTFIKDCIKFSKEFSEMDELKNYLKIIF
jgi:hypothetical protein